jgi:hypothetical protein
MDPFLIWKALYLGFNEDHRLGIKLDMDSLF